MSETTSIPTSYIGLWQRKGIWRSNGTSDLTTLVLWFQSPVFHIDLRVGQIGFAGRTVVEGDCCTWHPEIAFPFLSSEVDTGVMRFDTPDLLHETAVDSSYHEEWHRISAGPVNSIRKLSADGSTVTFQLANDEWLAQASGRPNGASEISFARIHDGVWRIYASSVAGQEGHEIVPLTS